MGAELSAKNLKVFTANDKQYTQDNYYSLTLAKLPPKSEDGQLKSICVDKKADIIYILIEMKKIIHVIRIMAELEVMITLHPRVVAKVAQGT